jgi:L-alanine-DL-glutamate epimerase-like enolase superfamily enzyme
VRVNTHAMRRRTQLPQTTHAASLLLYAVRDQMWRASMPYGRKGIAVHALSAVDLALWDLLGQFAPSAAAVRCTSTGCHQMPSRCCAR